MSSLPAAAAVDASVLPSITDSALVETVMGSPAALSSTTVYEYVATGSAWAPTALMAHAIENVHYLTGGGSWALSIALFTLGIRAALLPATVLQTRTSVAAAEHKPETDRLRQESMAYQQAGNVEGARKKVMELSAYSAKHKIGIGRLLGLGLIPMPFFMSTFFALQNMAQQPVQSMLAGGAWWFPDLCAHDPYYILPVLTTATLLSSLEASRFLSPNTNTPMAKMIVRGMALISIPITAFMPSGVVIYFITSNIITTMIQLSWRSAWIRRIFKISLPSTTPAAAASQAASPSITESFMHAFKSSLNPPASGTDKAYEKQLRKALRR